MSENVCGIQSARCRVCGGMCHATPLLRYEAMPRAAQFLPTPSRSPADHGVPVEVRHVPARLVQLAGNPVPYYREVIRAAAFSPKRWAFPPEAIRRVHQAILFAREEVLEIGSAVVSIFT